MLLPIPVPLLQRLTFGKRPKSKQKGLPLHTARLRRVPSLHRRSRGTPRRAIPGPSRLSRHPCRSTPYTTIPLGLLTGRLMSPARSVTQYQAKQNTIVPTLCVATPLGTLRVPPLAGGRDRLRRCIWKWSTRSVEGCITTRSVGTIKSIKKCRQKDLEYDGLHLVGWGCHSIFLGDYSVEERSIETNLLFLKLYRPCHSQQREVEFFCLFDVA